MIAGATRKGICILYFDETLTVKGCPESPYTDQDKEPDHFLDDLNDQLGEYFAGHRKIFSVPLDPDGNDFSKEAWNELLKIPYGSTRTYLQQAMAMKKPGAVRAVARANGMNKIAILIPCHRVIGTGGKLTGYSGGLSRKKWLLQHEKQHSHEAGRLF